ncbi:hypothetical protein ABC345_04130 [Shouchella sp. 1P09AA]|uniref:hypothetical protein n=1 Tax=Bacillaceae TaxID=186817 RepID=UPI000C07C28A|nr:MULTISPECIES: hypothetical protein [Bacillaceae]UTR07212.1 hypothetical protein MM326_04030 [Alkalihalobacillus sp. LMS6]
MYKIIRMLNGATETLKDTNSQLDKVFIDPVAAQSLASKLNNHLYKNAERWKVTTINGVDY